MAESAAETIVGAVVLAAAAGVLIFAGQTADLAGSGDRTELVARFRAADGVAVGTDVRMAGVKVGAVTSLALDPQTYQAVASLAIDGDILVPEDSDAKIASENLLGGTYIALTPGGSDFMLADGDEILQTQGSVSLLDLMLRFGGDLGGE
ncbi:MAG: outer membrane lipid asymmetry maintenance protein MlaD [Pseudomonadota bacterium]